MLLKGNQQEFEFRFTAKVYIDMRAFMKKVISDFYSIDAESLKIAWAHYRCWLGDFKKNGLCLSVLDRFFPMPSYVYFLD